MLKRNKNTTHPLCARCIKTCKQTVAVQLLSCPLYEPKMSNKEFEELLGEMETISRKADALHQRVSRLIDDMQVEKNPPLSEESGNEKGKER